MRSGFVHEATLELASGADQAAPGAAVTVELCGHWEHAGGCRWPHHTAVDQRAGQSVRLRVVFASAPHEAPEIRRRIGRALRGGHLDGPGGPSSWSVVRDDPGELRPDEQALAGRLAAG